MTGQNPMIAYVAGDLLIMPLLGICGVTPSFFIFIPMFGWDSFRESF
jgi:hypothetical protein